MESFGINYEIILRGRLVFDAENEQVAEEEFSCLDTEYLIQKANPNLTTINSSDIECLGQL